MSDVSGWRGDDTEGPGERRDAVGSTAKRFHSNMLSSAGNMRGRGNRRRWHLAGGDDDSLDSVRPRSIPSRRRKMSTRLSSWTRLPVPGGLQRQAEVVD
jgi:hypothetical protein